MKSEIDSMYTNQVWTLVDALESVTPIGYKWIFKKKIGVDDQEETYKARLVAKYFRQNKVLIMKKIFVGSHAQVYSDNACYCSIP